VPDDGEPLRTRHFCTPTTSLDDGGSCFHPPCHGRTRGSVGRVVTCPSRAIDPGRPRAMRPFHHPHVPQIHEVPHLHMAKPERILLWCVQDSTVATVLLRLRSAVCSDSLDSCFCACRPGALAGTDSRCLLSVVEEQKTPRPVSQSLRLRVAEPVTRRFEKLTRSHKN